MDNERGREDGQHLSVLTRRSTGFRSLNKHVHGHCADIAAQAGCHKAEAYTAVCWQAAEEHVIDLVQWFNRWMPRHESEWSSAQAADVVTLCHRFADERGYYLTEYVDGQPTRVWYGERKL